LMLQVFAAYPAIVLASCFGHRYHATPSHQSFSNSQWCNAFPVLPHIHAGPVKICTVLDLTKLKHSLSNCLPDWVTSVESALHSHMST